LVLDNWFKVQLIKELAPCPKCKKGIVKRGKTAWGCTLYGNGCEYLVAF
ncbi:MAG: DNA topoisomerase-3, partial [Glaciecola sp.]